MATGKDNLLKFLKGIKVDISAIKPLIDSFTEEVEDFDTDTQAATYLEARKDALANIMQADIDQKIEDALAAQKDAQYKSIAGPIIQRLIREGGLTFQKPTKELNHKEVLDAFIAKMADSGTHTDAALKKKHDDLLAEYNATLDKLEASEAKAEAAEQSKADFERNYQAKAVKDRMLSDIYNAIEWAASGTPEERKKKIGRECNVINSEIDKLFDVKEDGTFTHKDKSTPVMRPDEKGRYSHIKDWIHDYVKEYKLEKVANSREDMELDDQGRAFIERSKDKEKAATTLRQSEDRKKKLREKWDQPA